MAETIELFQPDAIHIATEGHLGLAARRYATSHDLNFTTAYHTRFPEYVRSRIGLPLSMTYMFLRWFHGSSQAVMAPTQKIVMPVSQQRFSIARQREHQNVRSQQYGAYRENDNGTAIS